MHPELHAWIALFNMGKSEWFAGQTYQLLKDAGATESDHEVFVALDSVLQKHRSEQIAAKRNQPR